jgi:hypothetical protein
LKSFQESNMRGSENVFMGLLAVLVMGLALPARSTPASTESRPAANQKSTAPEVTGPDSADVLTVMRPVLDRMRESVGLPSYTSVRGVSDEERMKDLLGELRRPVKCDPAAEARMRDIEFMLATVPDYVDSNTAWMADEVLGAVQAALPHQGYVLDRFYLPELPEDAASHTGQGDEDHQVDDKRPAKHGATRRPHEIQPGALIFRGTCGWQVVLITPETATLGLHVAAFETAARFIMIWKARMDLELGTKPEDVYKELLIVGPTFSGSIDFLVAALERLATTEPGPQSIRVISGSATADINPTRFKGLCENLKHLKGCSYAAAMHSNRRTVNELCAFLSRMNPSWVPAKVGVVAEANTSFGIEFRSLFVGCASRRYTFPLHVSQLRADASAAPALPVLLTSPATALKLGEHIHPVDLVPPMRPDVASPLTDQSIGAMLDDIRHSGLAAVGIYATDVRDALFLSREIKRAVPEVQLFFPSAHLLYLHPHFVAYTRGAIVASTYPLSPFPQLWGTRGEDSSLREVFPSTVAQGVFIATLTQARRGADYLPDFPYSGPVDEDSVGDPELGGKPGMWMSIVGDDGLWPVQQHPAADANTRGPLLKRSPRIVVMAGVVLALIVGGHAAAWRALEPLRRQHRPITLIGNVLVATLGFWMGTVAFVNWFGPELALAITIGLIPVAASTAIIAISPTRALSPWSAQPPLQARTIVRPFRVAEWVIGVCWLLPSVALMTSVISTYWVSGVAATAKLAAARTIGAGIASPGASTVCLLAALYVPVIWSLVRLKALGYGYGTLAAGSRAFRHLLGSEEGTQSLAELLDVPARHLPRWYLTAIAVILSVAAGLLWSNVATVDGMAYTLFLGSASLIGVAAALALLVQSAEIWRRLQMLLMTMADLPLATALARLGLSRLRWHISVVPPDTRDLRIPLSLAAELRDHISDASVAALFGPETTAALDRLADDGGDRRTAVALTQSATWLELWTLSDALLPALVSCRWTKCAARTRRLASETPPVAACLDCCETLMAAVRALVLRDWTSRIMSGVFAAMVILGLLIAAHLLYAFQGRAFLLGLDVSVLMVASLAAVWILIGLEKDAILSLIWRTTPGRVTFNWLLVQRLVVYGVLPLLLVLGSMFPEVGETLVRLMEPLRKLTSL